MNSTKHNNHHQLVKVCRVCGDRAIAFNFNGLTCESCKSFFRRNACKSGKFTCTKNEKCEINLASRNVCKKCRLLKCFEIGMRKEMVLEKKNKIKCASSSPEQQKPEVPLIDLLWKQIDAHYDENFIEYEDDEQLVAKLEIFNQKIDLNSYEQNLIDEINEANAANFVEELSLEVKSNLIGTFAENLNLPGLYIRKIIKYCKQMTPFKMLNEQDQILIIKPYFTEMLLARFTFAYSIEENAFAVITEDSQFGRWMQVGKLEEYGQFEFAKEYRKFIKFCQDSFQHDVCIRNLISTLLMFRPRTGISCPEHIRYHYHVYKRLLGRYLEHKYQDGYKAADAFDQLMIVLDEITKFREPISNLYTLVEMQEVMDVLHEIYDLKLRFDKLALS